MKQKVVLWIQGRQSYEDQEPDIIELTTEGTMEFRDGGWDICYQETELTGMAGVTTTFRVEPDTITLTRVGKLHSQMIFRKDQCHESLYQMEFGALLISVCARHMFFDLSSEGGVVDLVYSIDIENTAMGMVDYHLVIQAQ